MSIITHGMWHDKLAEISRLKAELEEVNKHLDDSISINRATEATRMIIERQLAEAKASAEAWQENCRLTERELEKERNKHADIIGKLAERDAEIATLRYQSINWVPVFDENMVLQTQLAALREEVERYKAGVEVDGVAVKYADVFPSKFVSCNFPDELIGQTVRVLVIPE